MPARKQSYQPATCSIGTSMARARRVTERLAQYSASAGSLNHSPIHGAISASPPRSV